MNDRRNGNTSSKKPLKERKMFGLEINQLANLLKQTNPNQNDSDSEDEQV
jgi:hypothetical protein